MTDKLAPYTDAEREAVSRAICSSLGKDPDAPFLDRHGRVMDFPEWNRWQGEAGAAIRAYLAVASPVRAATSSSDTRENATLENIKIILGWNISRENIVAYIDEAIRCNKAGAK